MKAIFILFILTAIIVSCDNAEKKVDIIKLDSNDDTLEVIKHYPTGDVKEIVYYHDNMPVDNIGFYLDGDTIKKPYAVYSKLDNNLFVFIPYNKWIHSYDLIFGVDSAFAVEQTRMDKFHELLDGFHEKMRNLNSSVNVKLDTAVINLGISKGVLKCKIDTVGEVYKYWGFDLNSKDFE